jgi:hypothetical protein
MRDADRMGGLGRTGLPAQYVRRLKMDDQNKEKADRQATGYKDRFWIPRFWTGMSFFGWWGLLWRNRAAIHPTCFGMATILSIASVVNAGLWALQSLVLGRRIRRTPARTPASRRTTS